MAKRLIDAEAADVEQISCYYGDQCYLQDVKEWLDEQPTVDAVEVVHGRWIPVIDEYPQILKMPMFTGYKCSVCGRYEAQEEPYCHCGAKMYGERKEK